MDIELKKEETPLKKNFDFVDTIRCISMIGIVFEHSASMWGIKYASQNDTWIQISTMQFWKFATIAFFLIAGFLINYKFTEYTPIQYLKRRFRNTIKPWLFWIAVLVILNLIHGAIIYLKGGKDLFGGNISAYFIEEFRYILFESSFWFILNFLICISILLVFKKYIYKLWFGLFWAIVSLIYSLNLYHEWFVTHHSAALFGFVFFLWLGVYLNRYYDRVMHIIYKVKWSWVLIINILFFLLSCAEVMYLMHHGSKDEYNTLRVSNILYSLSMFVLLLKMGSVKFIDKRLKPRTSTFGIYLIHQVLIIRLLPEIFKWNDWNTTTFTVIGNISYSIMRFLIVYSLSFILTRMILKTKQGWIVGG
ncbi:acyltransferase family protein [Pedobacter punctiformis]|uniref:Acyltransferase n=1 Tax=Pedobacter punctiformis TaxID=3004097 RepID=A0ABT4L6D2_9SPHI|nr:acyltransferase [Pedobacter sp. HCMS5-2]MCZ4243487.1 acyltransferase [Pedobacter sp. HCMS5-2]